MVFTRELVGTKARPGAVHSRFIVSPHHQPLKGAHAGFDEEREALLGKGGTLDGEATADHAPHTIHPIRAIRSRQAPNPPTPVGRYPALRAHLTRTILYSISGTEGVPLCKSFMHLHLGIKADAMPKDLPPQASSDNTLVIPSPPPLFLACTNTKSRFITTH